MRITNASRAAGIVALGVLLGLAATGAEREPPARPANPAPPAGAPASRAQARPARALERPVPFEIGETLEYDISWSSYLIAGTATVRVEEKRPSYGSTAYSISAEGRSTPLLSRLYPVYCKVDTLLDVYTLLPQKGSVYVDENGRRQTKITLFDQARRKADYEVRTDTVVTDRFSLPPSTQDALSAVFVLRTYPLVKGASITMFVADNGRVQTVRMTVGAREEVRTAAGSFRAWHIAAVLADTEGVQPGRNLALWISADSRRLPVRLEVELPVGRFALLLRDVAARRVSTGTPRSSP